MITFSIVVSAIATVVIAWFAIQSYILSEQIKKDSEKHQQETKDLYQAIVIATILSGPSSYGQFPQAKETFREFYKGKTEIFEK